MSYVKRFLEKFTDPPPEDHEFTQEQIERVMEGRLDYRKGMGFHDPRGYDPEQSRRNDIVRRL